MTYHIGVLNDFGENIKNSKRFWLNINNFTKLIIPQYIQTYVQFFLYISTYILKHIYLFNFFYLYLKKLIFLQA